MDLALELMREGSHQVEASDEGLMTDEIEQSLRVVIRAVDQSKLPATQISTWCKAMLKSDRVGFLCTVELHALQGQFRPT